MFSPHVALRTIVVVAAENSSNNPPDERSAAGTPGSDAGPAQRELSVLTASVYHEMRAIAARQMARERRGHTLQATALVHEAYQRLIGRDDLDPVDRYNFFAAAADAMRKILIDSARRRGAVKRGGDWRRCTLGGAYLADDDDAPDFVALDEAFLRLQQSDPRAAEIVRLRFYAGLEIEEVAKVLEVSPRTIKRDWTYARAWLLEDLQRRM